MQVAIPLFDRFTALDAIGPYEVLCRLPATTVTFVSHREGPVTADSRSLTVDIDTTFDDLPEPDVLVMPGGWGTRALLDDDILLDWLRRADRTSRFTTSVCTGSLVLAAAGLLDGVEATTHWAAVDELRDLGATFVDRRVVEHGKVITGAGISSGIDMALTLAARLTDDATAEAIQLMIEYDPRPPFDSGAVDKADDETIARTVELLGELRRR